MSPGEIFLFCMAFSMLAMIWIVFFVALDDFVLNGYFRKQLQKRFKAE